MVRTSSALVCRHVYETGCSERESNTDVLLVAVLQAGLQANFAEVQVSVVECPDLTKEPFHFPVKGKSKSDCIPPHCTQFTCFPHAYVLNVYLHSVTPPGQQLHLKVSLQILMYCTCSSSE